MDQTIPVLDQAERHQQLLEWNATAADYPRERCLHELITQQAAKTPDAIAVVYEDQHLTYSDLDRRANQLAHYLTLLEVGPDVVVGLCAERSIEMVVGLLGILKAGGAYLPLDPSYPKERLSYMLEDSGAKVLLTQIGNGRCEEFINEVSTHTFILELTVENPLWADSPTTAPDLRSLGLTSQHLAYVIYTSGSRFLHSRKRICSAWQD